MIRKYEILKAADEHYAGNGHRRDRFIFREGAKWADQTMIDKAIKWLDDNLDSMVSMTPEGEIYWMPDCLDKFRKAME